MTGRRRLFGGVLVIDTDSNSAPCLALGVALSGLAARLIAPRRSIGAMVHPAIASAVVLASRLVLASGVLAMLATYARRR